MELPNVSLAMQAGICFMLCLLVTHTHTHTPFTQGWPFCVLLKESRISCCQGQAVGEPRAPTKALLKLPPPDGASGLAAPSESPFWLQEGPGGVQGGQPSPAPHKRMFCVGFGECCLVLFFYPDSFQQ